MVKDARDKASGKRSLFLGPENLQKLMTDPRTRSFLSQPDFMQMLKDCEEDPNKLEAYMKDDRMRVTLGVIMGVDLSNMDELMKEKGEAETGAATKSEPRPEPRPEPVPEVSDEVKRSLEEKEKGNAAYKARDFDKAIAHYDAAIALDPENVSFITNKAAVKFEQGKYDECIKDCEEAIEKGRSLRADYKLIARAMTRIGNSQVKLGMLEEAISTYNKSLTEHRSADTLKRLNETERALKKSQEDAYIDMALCTEEKEKGNEAFKAQNFPEAVKHYTEALKRGPPGVNEEAHKLYSNRAACYTKLGAWNEGIKDADKCIELAPDFAKGYVLDGGDDTNQRSLNRSIAHSMPFPYQILAKGPPAVLYEGVQQGDGHVRGGAQARPGEPRAEGRAAAVRDGDQRAEQRGRADDGGGAPAAPGACDGRPGDPEHLDRPGDAQRSSRHARGPFLGPAPPARPGDRRQVRKAGRVGHRPSGLAAFSLSLSFMLHTCIHTSCDVLSTTTTTTTGHRPSGPCR